MTSNPRAGNRACPVCGSEATFELLDRPSVPVHQNLLYVSAEAARASPRGDLVLRLCQGCGFCWNAAFDPGLLRYGAEYDNTQAHSDTFDRYLDDLVRRLVEIDGVRASRAVEVGCGKGGFLKKLVAYPGSGNTGLGFDPTYVGPDTDLGGRVHFHRRFYDRSAADVPADVVICRHVIEHVPAPLALLGAVRQALGGAVGARIFFETPCLEWILRGRVFWDFFYEHCSLFTAQSLTVAANRAGFRVFSVDHVFGGQYLWLSGKADDAIGARPEPPTDLLTLAREFARGESSCRERWRVALQDLKGRGPVALWGAGAKGVTFCNLADPDGEFLACVVDVNPAKQGKFVAGTGHRIVSSQALLAIRPASVLVLNPNYLAEITEQLRSEGSPATIVDFSQS